MYGSWTDFWIGNGLNVVKVMPESAVKFGAFEVGNAKEYTFADSDRKVGIEAHVCQDRRPR